MNDAELAAAVTSPAVHAAIEMANIFAREDRLFSAIVGDDPDLCWPFKGIIGGDGYGTLLVKGKRVRAHRVAFILANKRPLGAKEQVLHSCDVRACCNPAHLSIGDDAINGRHRRERGNHMPIRQKIDYLEAQEIREFFKAGVTLMALASVYGLGFSTVRSITTGETYQKWRGWQPYEGSDGPNLHGPILRRRPLAN